MSAAPIRVVVIDGSARCRRKLRAAIDRAGLSVVGEAADARAGRDLIVALDPDIVTLDLALPDVDGLTLLRAIHRHAPRPVIVVADGAGPGSAAQVAALEAGATHVLAKPAASDAAPFATELVHRLRQAAAAGARFHRGARATRAACEPLAFAAGQLVVIGASTGGPAALRDILEALPPRCPPIVIAQHLPPDQPSALAERLASSLGRDVARASDGEGLADGMVRIARPDVHLTVARRGDGFATRLLDAAAAAALAARGPRPSVDVLMRSAAAAAGPRAVGVLLTGMGDDGAAGLATMRTAGASTIAQDEATSVVFGMPRAAIARGAAGTIAGVDRIAAAIVRGLRRAP